MENGSSEKEPLDNEDVTIELNNATAEHPETTELTKQLHFADGERRIDFVLVYSKEKRTDAFKEKQEYFLVDLETEGLEFETEEEEENDLVFVKVHAPYETLARYAEIMKIRKPMKQTLFEGTPESLFSRQKSTLKSLAHCADFLRMFHHRVDAIPPIERRFTWPFSVDKQYLFAIPEKRSDFFESAERGMIVDYIMRRARFTDRPGMFGLAKLLQDGVFDAAYPLHEPLISPDERIVCCAVLSRGGAPEVSRCLEL